MYESAICSRHFYVVSSVFFLIPTTTESMYFEWLWHWYVFMYIQWWWYTWFEDDVCVVQAWSKLAIIQQDFQVLYTLSWSLFSSPLPSLWDKIILKICISYLCQILFVYTCLSPILLYFSHFLHEPNAWFFFFFYKT